MGLENPKPRWRLVAGCDSWSDRLAAVAQGLAACGVEAYHADLAVVDDQGETTQTGVEGDIAVRVEPQRPVGMFIEYYRDADASTRCIRNGSGNLELTFIASS